MRSRFEIVRLLMEAKLIAVIRTNRGEQVQPVCEALVAGGITALEITLTTPNAIEAIREARATFGHGAVIGAGTVLTAASTHEVIAAGAEFVVSPITRTEIVEAAHSRERPVMIGAYTPTEMQTAHEAGADFIKLFPADKLGAAYVKSVRGPLPDLRIVPTGGVDLNTMADFLNAGCAALGVGSSLITSEILRTENWTDLRTLAGEFVRVAREAKK
ncbi:MAG TPA: bifunctional 4-hydroxy-2-oxoglutarate aldolase/2-dehydro-3-deoxy-phosphogluconate aldolase [Verrucomicrobiae bacterium]|nr:bifunctional 4-hydroxy-2-oxoglutarate aldolase/2-dehydro-3-deoxy-phosphogluconate aldolase [Verrucomicrobiae bacterium]